MESRGTYLRVGLLLVFGVVALVGLITFFGGNRVRNGAYYETYFRESVQGLDVGAPVKFRGVTIGQVTQIGLVTGAYGGDFTTLNSGSSYALVYVRFRVDLRRIGVTQPPIETLVQQGLRARLASQGITGVAYLEMDFVSGTDHPAPKVPWEPRYPFIPSVPSTLLQVQDSAQLLLQKLSAVDFNGLAAGLTVLLGDLHGDLSQGDVHMLLTQATATLKSLQDNVAAADLPAVSTDLRQTLASVRNTADGAPTRQLLANANTAVTRLSAATAQLPQLIAALQQVARRTNDSTADIEQGLGPMLRDLQSTLANLRDTTADLRRDPGQVLFGAPPPRAGQNR